MQVALNIEPPEAILLLAFGGSTRAAARDKLAGVQEFRRVDLSTAPENSSPVQPRPEPRDQQTVAAMKVILAPNLVERNGD